MHLQHSNTVGAPMGHVIDSPTLGVWGSMEIGPGTTLTCITADDAAALAAAASSLGRRIAYALTRAAHEFTPAPDNPNICDACGTGHHTPREVK